MRRFPGLPSVTFAPGEVARSAVEVRAAFDDAGLGHDAPSDITSALFCPLRGAVREAGRVMFGARWSDDELDALTTFPDSGEGEAWKLATRALGVVIEALAGGVPHRVYALERQDLGAADRATPITASAQLWQAGRFKIRPGCVRVSFGGRDALPLVNRAQLVAWLERRFAAPSPFTESGNGTPAVAAANDAGHARDRALEAMRARLPRTAEAGIRLAAVLLELECESPGALDRPSWKTAIAERWALAGGTWEPILNRKSDVRFRWADGTTVDSQNTGRIVKAVRAALHDFSLHA